MDVVAAEARRLQRADVVVAGVSDEVDVVAVEVGALDQVDAAAADAGYGVQCAALSREVDAFLPLVGAAAAEYEEGKLLLP